MTKRTVLICKVIECENWKNPGQTVEIINPFGRHGTHGKNDPENMMVMKWSGPSGATYTFDHRYDSSYPREKKENTATIKASYGQEMTLELGDIDDEQDISEVTIRGVKYVPT